MKLYPDVFNLYAAESGRLRTKASKDGYKAVCRQLQKQFPDTHVGQFTPQMLTDFCVGNGRYAPNTMGIRKTVLQGVFGWAEWKQLIKTNPASSLKYTVPSGKQQVRPGRWLEESTMGDVLRQCGDDLVGRRDRLVLLLGFLMGLRRFELADLRWSNFSWGYKTVQIVGKGGKVATLGVPPQVIAALTDWRQEVPEGCDTVLPVIMVLGFNGHETQVFWDKPLKRDGIARIVSKAARRAGLDHLAPHDMRRSFAGLLEDRGKAVTDIQRAMRHSNVGVTSVYLDKNPRKTVAVTEGLSIDY